MNDARLKKLHNQFVQKVTMRKLFTAWVGTLDLFKRERLLHQTASIMYSSSTLEKCFNFLRVYSDQNARSSSIVRQFKQRTNYNYKSIVIMSLHQHIIDNRIRKTQFYNKINFLALKATEPIFERWIEFVIEERMKVRADKFYSMRHAQYLKRLSFDSLNINKLKEHQKTIQYNAIQQWYTHKLMMRSFVSLKTITYEKQRITNIQSIIGIKTDIQTAKYYFDLLRDAVSGQKMHKIQKQRATTFNELNSCRKVFIGIQTKIFTKQRVAVIAEKSRNVFFHKFLTAWRGELAKIQKVRRLAQILQDQNENKLLHTFIPKMTEMNYFDQVGKFIEQSRSRDIKQEFINQLRKKILQKKIQYSFAQKRLRNLRRQVFIELRSNALEHMKFENSMLTHIFQQEEESNFEVM
jgi:hypothetical protein